MPRPAPPIPRVLVALLLGIVAVPLFWSMRDYRRPGGDTDEVVARSGWRHWTWHSREPGAYLINQAFVKALAPHGFDTREAIAASSCVAGGLFVFFVFASSTHPLTWVIHLGSGTILLFLGHLENYTWVFLMLAVWYRLSQAYLEGRCRFVWPAVMFALALVTHRLAIVFSAGIILAVWRLDGRRLRFRASREDVRDGLLVCIATSVASLLAASWMNNLVTANELTVLMVHPTTGSIAFPWQQYALLEPRHLWVKAVMFVRIAPLGLLPVLYCMRTPCAWARIQTTLYGQVLVCTLGHLALWYVFWNPGRHADDWDLFAMIALPINAMGAYLIERGCPGRRVEPETTVD